MIATEMVSKLGERLDHDAPERSFGLPERYALLDEGQQYVVQELPINMVRPVEKVSTAQAVDASGGVALGSLDPLILNGDRGILDVLHSSGYYCTEISDDDEWRLSVENNWIFSTNAPRYRLQGTDLLLRPFTFGSTTGVIRYKSVPATITSSVDCALSGTVQELIVDYALYLGLKTAKDYNAAGSLLKLVDSQITAYVNTYVKKRTVRMAAGMMDGYGGGGGRGDIKTFG
ncbi:MAG: hypothetical protein FVQ81_02090 [Candidatus Glassbacteria bacterium]|nr:hypothetical protein [Candidatus Glassbacteria bacterium]